jgi:hypothetical protein
VPKNWNEGRQTLRLRNPNSKFKLQERAPLAKPRFAPSPRPQRGFFNNAFRKARASAYVMGKLFGPRPSGGPSLVLSAEVARALHFAYADALDKGWDVRDARGRSARVYAPGSRRRERRPKEWGEKTENIRAVRNVAIAGTVAGAVGAGYLLRKNSGLKRTVAAADQNAKTAVVKRIQAAQAKARDLKIKRTMREAAASPSANFPALRLA